MGRKQRREKKPVKRELITNSKEKNGNTQKGGRDNNKRKKGKKNKRRRINKERITTGQEITQRG